MKVFQKCNQFAFALIALGCIIFISGLFATEHIEYGGDAYTGIQNAAADTAKNVLKVGGIIVSALGGMLFAFSEIKAFEFEENQKKHKELLNAFACKTLDTGEKGTEKSVS